MTEHYIRYMDFAGNLIETITDFALLEYGRAKNEIGVLDMALPANAMPVLPIVDGRLEVYRKVGAGAFYLDGETQWLIRKFWYSGHPNNPTLNIQAFDMMTLLDRRYVEYPADTTYTSKTDFTDDMMKDIADENAGAAALVATRNMAPYLSIQADLGLAPATTKAFSWRKMFPLLQELAEISLENGTWLGFDVVKVSDTESQFRTYANYRGNDVSASVTVSPENGALVDAVLMYDYSGEITEVTAGGRGEGVDRVTVPVTDPVRLARSPLNRIEKAIDARQTESTAALLAEAEAELKAGRPKIILEGQINDTDDLKFGVHYNYGDIITAQYMGIVIPCHVDMYSIRVQGGDETRTIKIRGEVDA